MLAELVSYYDQLVRDHPDEVAPLGWNATRIGYHLQIDDVGRICALVPMTDKSAARRFVPMQKKRAVNIDANFLCDNSSYVFGVDNKGKPERSVKCFEAARILHHEVLDGLASPCAKAILNFFDTWMPDPERFEALFGDSSLLSSGGNIAFIVDLDGTLYDPLQDGEIRDAWNSYHLGDGGDPVMRCLVTGRSEPVARLHPAIKGVFGAQSSGASLVSFNAEAFESHGHNKEQGLNAPIGQSSAQKYALALNYLLSKPEHHVRLGDTTIVYWADSHDTENAKTFNLLLSGSMTLESTGTIREDAQSHVDSIMKAVAKGEYRNIEGIEPNASFYILGIAPSAARLVVKFFIRDNFGVMLDNLGKHYRRSDVAHADFERPYLTPWQLLREVENPNASQSTLGPVLSGPLLESMILDAPYPQSLYANALLRIHATQNDSDKHTRKVSRGRASIIRAYLIKNCNKDKYDERSVTVALNPERNETAYNLGRAFALFEQIQEEANGKATLANRYYNSASATPVAVFPTLIKLSKAHLAKIRRLKPGLAAWFEKQLGEVFGEDRIYTFPRRLTLEEQGDFALGVYHQTAKRYERKSSDENRENVDSEE